MIFGFFAFVLAFIGFDCLYDAYILPYQYRQIIQLEKEKRGDGRNIWVK